MTAVMDQKHLQIRVSQGDKEALGVLLESQYRPLFNYLLRLAGGNRAVAEDLVQETMAKAIAGARGYDPETPFAFWIFRVARNAFYDHLRRNALRNPPGRQAPEPVSQDDPVAGAARSELAGTLSNALDALPEEQREVVALKFYAGLTFREIAELQGCPIGTCLARMRYALEALRKLAPEFNLKVE